MSVPCFFYGAHYKIKQLLLRTRAQLRAALCGIFMLLLGASQEVTKKDAKTFPLGSPLSVPLFKNKDEKNIYIFLLLSPLCHHERQAEKAKSFLLGD